MSTLHSKLADIIVQKGTDSDFAITAPVPPSPIPPSPLHDTTITSNSSKTHTDTDSGVITHLGVQRTNQCRRSSDSTTRIVDNSHHHHNDPAAATGGFLQDVDPFVRRQLLAFHTQYTLKVKYDHAMETNDVIVKREPSLPFQHYRHIDSEDDSLRVEDSSSTGTSSSSSSECEGQQQQQQQQQVSKRRSARQYPGPIEIRSNIYEKFFIHFQNLYNEHDGLAMATLLMIPCCTTGVSRDVLGWMPDPTQQGKMTLRWKRSVQGELFYRGGFEYLFNKLPDCVIVFHSVECHHFHNGSVVIAPYTYFFSMVVPVAVTTSSSQDTGNASAHKQVCVSKVIEVEIAGCKVNYYNRDNLIVRQAQHVALKSCSDPTVSPYDIVKIIYPM